MKFELTENQVNKYNTWKKRMKPKYKGVLGSNLGITFSFTGIGTAIHAHYFDGEKTHNIDLTDYDTW